MKKASTPYRKPLCKYSGLFSRQHRSKILSVARYASVFGPALSKKYPQKFAQELQIRSTRIWISALFLFLSCVLTSCSEPPEGGVDSSLRTQEEISSESISAEEMPGAASGPETEEERISIEFPEESGKKSTEEVAEELARGFEDWATVRDIVYSGEPYIILNNNIPFFTKDNLPTESFEYYSALDGLGRCGIACASIGQDIMPTEKRGNIGHIKPSGWHTVKYDTIDGIYLYNRCHLIAYELAGENANEENLITGTGYMNRNGMLPFENMVADYVKETNNHVLYRVTPIFADEKDLLAYGVIMEGWSVEDDGEGICINVFVFNVQPGIVIDYATGESCLADSDSSPETRDLIPQGTINPPASEDSALTASECRQNSALPDTEEMTVASEEVSRGITYILNTNTMKFHYPDCSSVEQMAEQNKQEHTGSRDEVVSMGYDACKRCKP